MEAVEDNGVDGDGDDFDDYFDDGADEGPGLGAVLAFRYLGLIFRRGVLTCSLHIRL